MAAYRDFNYTGTYAICLVIDSRFSAPRRIFIRVSSLSLSPFIIRSSFQCFRCELVRFGRESSEATLRPVFSATGSSFRIEFILSRNRCSVRWTTVRGGAVFPTVIPLLSLYRDFRLERKFFISSPPGFLYLRRCSSRRFKLITSRFPLGLAEINNRPS